MIKIKTKLFEYAIIFVNKILKKYNGGRDKRDKIINDLNAAISTLKNTWKGADAGVQIIMS